MAKANITQYSSTPSSNTDINSINIDENCPASGLNNAIRELMAHLKNVDTGSQALTSPSFTAMSTDTISEKTSANGVAIDGVTLKDGELGTTANPVAIHSTSLNGGQFGGRRNMIINGSQIIAQRATQVTSISSEGYKTVDRFKWTMDSTSAVFTHSQSTDVPTGEGFANSFKAEVTTADTSLATNAQTRFEYRFEGRDVQQLAKGTSSAKKVTLSFWVKAYQTGTYVVNIQDTDNSRLIGKTYTVNSSATWEYKTITFDGDTTGTLNNDNNLSLVLHWYLGAGSDYTSGTLATSWESLTNANRAVGQTVDIATSTSNYWQITGIQLEVGEQATPFEHRSYGEELALCQRYFYAVNEHTSTYGYPFFVASAFSATQCNGGISLPVPMRATPTNSYGNSFRFYRNGTYDGFSALSNDASSNLSLNFAGSNTLSHTAGTSGNIQVRIPDGGYIEADAEL